MKLFESANSAMADKAVSKQYGTLDAKMTNDRKMGSEIESKKGELEYTKNKVKNLETDIRKKQLEKQQQEKKSGLRTEDSNGKLITIYRIDSYKLGISFGDGYTYMVDNGIMKIKPTDFINRTDGYMTTLPTEIFSELENKFKLIATNKYGNANDLLIKMNEFVTEKRVNEVSLSQYLEFLIHVLTDTEYKNPHVCLNKDYCLGEENNFFLNHMNMKEWEEKCL